MHEKAQLSYQDTPATSKSLEGGFLLEGKWSAVPEKLRDPVEVGCATVPCDGILRRDKQSVGPAPQETRLTKAKEGSQGQ
jgi:hypothetical protein